MRIRSVLPKWLSSSRRLDSGIAPGMTPGMTPGLGGGEPLPPTPAGRAKFLTDHVFIHVHNEKTGGTVLTHGLATIVGWTHTMDMRRGVTPSLDTLGPSDLAQIRLFAAHFGYGEHINFKQKPLYISSVRDPADRFVSFYRYVVVRPEHPAYGAMVNRNPTDAYAALADGDHDWFVKNQQAQMLLGADARIEITAEKAHAHVRQNYFMVMPMSKVSVAIRGMRAALLLPSMRPERLNVGNGPKIEIPLDLRRRIRKEHSIDAALVREAARGFDVALEQAQTYIANRCAMGGTGRTQPD